MKNKLSVIILTVVLLSAFAVGALAAESDITDGIKDSVGDILGYKLYSAEAVTTEEWISGELSSYAGVSSEWYAFALSQSGDYDLSAYAEALKGYVSEREISSAVTRQKYALLLLAADGDKDVAEELADNTAGAQGIMSLVYAIHLSVNGISPGEDDVFSLTEKILELQRDDGGWSLSGKSGDPDVTAMVLEALALISEKTAEVLGAVDRALCFLSSAMLEDGDYKSYGVANAESTAQVICALSSLGIDAQLDERFVKNGKTLFDGLAKYRLSDGSFSHLEGGASSDTATVQALCAYVSYLRFTEGESPIYLLDRQRGVVSGIDISPNRVESSGGADDDKSVGYKVWACGAVVILSFVAVVIFIITGKRNIKNFIFIICVASVVIMLILVTDVQSREKYYSDTADIGEAVGQVTISINCSVINGIITNEYIPDDGVILDRTAVDIRAGDTVYDALITAAKKHGIHLESSGGDGMKYVSGISYLYEFDCGDLSGWMYYVNGETVSVGCDGYKLSDGDVVEWKYTLDLGRSFE